MSAGFPTTNREALLKHLEWALNPQHLGTGLALAIADLPLSLCSDSAITRLKACLRTGDQLFDYEPPRLAFVLRNVGSEVQASDILKALFDDAMAQWLALSIRVTRHSVNARQWLEAAQQGLTLTSSADGHGCSTQAGPPQTVNHPPALAAPGDHAEGSANPSPNTTVCHSQLPAEVMETILDNIDAYIFIKDESRIYRYANLPLESLYGFSRSEIVGKDDSAFHSGESLQALWRNDDFVMKSERPIFAEEQVFDHDGNEGWYMSRKLPIHLPDAGRCLLGMAIDITKYKTAIANLARSELKFKSLFQASLDAVGVIDSEGSIREINDAALLMFGCNDREHFLTLRPADLSPSHQPDGRPSELAAAEHIASAMQNGSHEFEWVHHRLDTGSEFLALVSMNRIELDGLPAILTRERDISLERSYEQRLRKLAYTDPLTGLSNYQASVDWLHTHRELAHHSNLLVVAFDIDDFNKYNQAYEREVGDEFLNLFANALRLALQPDALAARLQADEFLAILPLTNNADQETDIGKNAENAINQIRASIDQHLRENPGQRHIPTYCTGAALFQLDRDHEQTDADQEAGQNWIDTLLLRANAALKHASHSGAGQSAFFDASMLSASKDEVRVATELTQAIASGRLCLHYQPIVNRAGKIIAAEALIRYRLEDSSLIFPDQFIAIAEKKGQIIPLGNHIVELACRQLSAWRSSGLFIDYLSINLSAVQLRDGGLSFHKLIAEAVERYKLEPGMIQLEITETVVLNEIGSVDETLNELARTGFHLAIDDFGTGYSSLSTLQRLPFTTLKIDKSFVIGINQNQKKRNLAKSCLSIANSMGLRCVAEGVESEADREALIQLGCHYFQGFLFDRGLDASAFEHRLLSQRGSA